MDEEALVPIGKIVGTHGIKGHLKVMPYGDSMDLFSPGKKLTVSREGDALATFRIAFACPHNRLIRLGLENIGSIEVAETWIGCQLYIDKASLPQLEEGSYYWQEIMGLEAFTLDDRRLGRVEAILPTGSNDVYVVKDGSKELLIPAIDSVVVDIDLDQKVLRVDLPKGLED
ncbi:MAG: ribosome maturation factor RimM [Deltaproteobacteria bacterium]|jgi:16S rRNA processing protein RimM